MDGEAVSVTRTLHALTGTSLLQSIYIILSKSAPNDEAAFVKSALLSKTIKPGVFDDRDGVDTLLKLEKQPERSCDSQRKLDLLHESVLSSLSFGITTILSSTKNNNRSTPFSLPLHTGGKLEQTSEPI